jgi:hypothetical protein
MRGQKVKRTFMVLVLTAFVATILSGCSNFGVKPWERKNLARSDMALDANFIDLALDDHIYFSKEASSGGRSFAGGGCGCN